MNESELTRKVVSTFETLDIPYFITGSIASIALGEPRYTNDIDVVADISGVDLIMGRKPWASALRLISRNALASGSARLKIDAQVLAAFPSPEFYVSESAVRAAVLKRFQFNIIHPTSGLKVDVMIPTDDVYNRLRMSRRVRLDVDRETDGWFSSAEDLILKKLEFYRLGGSEKHLRDISGILLVQGERIDQSYLDKWAALTEVTGELELVRKKLSEYKE